MIAQRRGVALLECLIALTIVAVAGVALLSLASESTQRLAAAQAADDESRVASAFLDAVSLWSRTELEQRLGARAQGSFTLTIQRPDPTRFQISVSDSAGRRLLLATTFYRPARVEHP